MTVLATTADGAVREMDFGDVMIGSLQVKPGMNHTTAAAFPLERESNMQPKTSRDISGQEPRKDEEREQQQAVIKDADKTGQSDWDRVHGDGSEIGLDDKK